MIVKNTNQARAVDVHDSMRQCRLESRSSRVRDPAQLIVFIDRQIRIHTLFIVYVLHCTCAVCCMSISNSEAKRYSLLKLYASLKVTLRRFHGLSGSFSRPHLLFMLKWSVPGILDQIKDTSKSEPCLRYHLTWANRHARLCDFRVARAGELLVKNSQRFSKRMASIASVLECTYHGSKCCSLDLLLPTRMP